MPITGAKAVKQQNRWWFLFLFFLGLWQHSLSKIFFQHHFEIQKKVMKNIWQNSYVSITRAERNFALSLEFHLYADASPAEVLPKVVKLKYKRVN